MFHFANLLFSGACNARCPFCIGKQIDPLRMPSNLGEFPPRGLDHFVELIHTHPIREVVLSGANTDPLLYAPLARLLDVLRARLPTETRLGLHTNGRLALEKMALVNRFDKLCISLPSFDPLVYREVMGVGSPPNLEAILEQVLVPVKLSCVIVEANQAHLQSYLEHCRTLGVRRVVLRKLFGDPRPWDELLQAGWGRPQRDHHSCAVFLRSGLEVTLWDFERAEAKSINLFASGEISADYQLVKHGSIARGA